MKNKIKLICYCFAMLCVGAMCVFGVYAVSNFSLVSGGTIKFVAPGIDATISNATLTGLSKKDGSGQMSTFTITPDMSESQIQALAGYKTWSGIHLLFDDESEGIGKISFTITNNSEKAIENIMVELSTNTTALSPIQATPSADFCINPGEEHTFDINLAVSNTDETAKIEDFELVVELKVVKTSQVMTTQEYQSNGFTIQTQTTGTTRTAVFEKYTPQTAAASTFASADLNVEIPSVVKGADNKIYTITEIKAGTETDNAFSEVCSTLKTVKIPQTITKIGAYAFYNCTELQGNLNLHNGLVSIGSYSFYACSKLTGDLIIPDTVTFIGNYAFYNCTGLNGILYIGKGVTQINEYVFQNCTSLIGDLILPNSVTSVGRSAFEYCENLNGKLQLSDKLETVGIFAFRGCKKLVGDLIIPDSVTCISEKAFSDLRGLDGKFVLSKNVTEIGFGAFENNFDMTGDLVLPKGLTKISGFAFEECSSLTGDLIIPNGVEKIEYHAFSGCKELKGKLVIPNTVTTIEYGAFSICGFTGDIIVPSSVTTMGNYVFKQTKNVSSFTFSSTTPPTIGTECFNDTNNAPIYVPSASVNAYKTAENWSEYADRIFAIGS